MTPTGITHEKGAAIDDKTGAYLFEQTLGYRMVEAS